MKQTWLRLPARRIRLAVAGRALLLAVAAAMQASPAASAPLAAHRAAGAGHTIMEGWAGGSEPVPVTTLVAFRVTAAAANPNAGPGAPRGPPARAAAPSPANVM
jgi:hypothetical protein